MVHSCERSTHVYMRRTACISNLWSMNTRSCHGCCGLALGPSHANNTETKKHNRRFTNCRTADSAHRHRSRVGGLPRSHFRTAYQGGDTPYGTQKYSQLLLPHTSVPNLISTGLASLNLRRRSPAALNRPIETLVLPHFRHSSLSALHRKLLRIARS